MGTVFAMAYEVVYIIAFIAAMLLMKWMFAGRRYAPIIYVATSVLFAVMTVSIYGTFYLGGDFSDIDRTAINTASLWTVLVTVLMFL